ncbi:hypothetical protein [Nocardia sp. alder85J]|uniref:hypothetical protein n=1 Tax=Nocardia sp. alder85J TaxID=2862949 RepID=UPI001CD3CA92|nr:hypothetical protein [Nocardia sp. alder85J]MCX4097718.1 hypothetical protein [Nocardia sp. alder85J]
MNHIIDTDTQARLHALVTTLGITHTQLDDYLGDVSLYDASNAGDQWGRSAAHLAAEAEGVPAELALLLSLQTEQQITDRLGQYANAVLAEYPGLAELRGALAGTVTPERVRAIAGEFHGITGRCLFAVWPRLDRHGYRGDPKLYIEPESNDSFAATLTDNLRSFLTLPLDDPHSPRTPGHPDDWTGGWDMDLDVEDCVWDEGQLNGARIDRR